MTAREEIKALREEVAALRAEVARLSAEPKIENHYHSHFESAPLPQAPPLTPYCQPQPVYVDPYPNPPWWGPGKTYCDGSIGGSTQISYAVRGMVSL